jgi:phage recombination protein Bet
MNTLTLWQDSVALAEIKKIYAPALNDNEWKIFNAIGQATKLNPYLREIWAVKYGNAPAAIFIGRDGYRKSAQAHKNYDYHIVDAVYSQDKFEVVDGTPKHTYNLAADRGTLCGAYCIVKRKSSTRPNFLYVELKEYNTKKSVWNDKPATMIKKVAEAQGLRMTFQELFAGTYEESEKWQSVEEEKKPNAQTGEIIEAEVKVEVPVPPEYPLDSLSSDLKPGEYSKWSKKQIETIVKQQGWKLFTGPIKNGKNAGKPYYKLIAQNNEGGFISEQTYEFLMPYEGKASHVDGP